MTRQAIRTLTSSTQTIHSVFDASGKLLQEYVWIGLTPIAKIKHGQCMVFWVTGTVNQVAPYNIHIVE